MNIYLLEKELRRDEGVRREPYTDTAGHLTIGVGFNLDAHTLPDGITMPLSDDEVDSLLDISVQEVQHGLDIHIPWWTDLDEVRQRVIANMVFNMGIYKVLGFINTLQAIKNTEYEKAAEGMRNSAWFKQVGQRAVRLANAMETGVMENA